MISSFVNLLYPPAYFNGIDLSWAWVSRSRVDSVRRIAPNMRGGGGMLILLEEFVVGYRAFLLGVGFVFFCRLFYGFV